MNDSLVRKIYIIIPSLGHLVMLAYNLLKVGGTLQKILNAANLKLNYD